MIIIVMNGTLPENGILFDIKQWLNVIFRNIFAIMCQIC